MDAYNYYDMCYPSCSECYEITKNDNDQQCSKCKADYYFELSPSTNCIDDCGKYLVSDSTQRKCINCKETFNYFFRVDYAFITKVVIRYYIKFFIDIMVIYII